MTDKKIKIPRIRGRHKRLWALIKQNRFRLYLAMLSSFLMAATSVSMAYLVKPAIDDIFVNRDTQTLALFPIIVLVIFSVRGIGYYGQEYFMNYVGQKIIRDLRNLLYDKIMDLPISFFQEEKTGGLMSRVTWDANIIREMVSRSITGAMRDFFSIVGLTGVIIYMNWRLALYALIVLPVAYYPVMYFGRRVRKWSTVSQEAMGELNAFLHETFAGNKIVKAFGMEDSEKKRFKDKTEHVFRLEIKAAIARSASSPLMEFLAGVGIAFVIWFGGYQVIDGASTPGTFFSFMAAVLMLYDPVKKLSYMNNSLQEGMAAADRIFDIVGHEPDIREPENPAPLPPRPFEVAFEKVSFSYDSGPEVLKDVSLRVAPGQVVALVGASGGGKTSLVNLIPRFFDVSAGRITLGGVDIRDIPIAQLRREIAVVTQEPILFNDTVRGNIAYGNPAASEQRIMEAAKSAFAHDFVMGFDKGFESNIGELGGRLSGGEKQRMCIARALLKDAPVLILDEATSSLDTEAERIVQKALENLMAGRTCFVIAHRLSTIRHADMILVMEKGRIVERGRHGELLERGGAYARLHDLQFATEKTEDQEKNLPEQGLKNP